MKSAKQKVPEGAQEIPVPFEIKLPEDTPEFMAPAYFGCLHWAIGEEAVLAEFTRDTGTPIPGNRSGIEKLVDQATGFNPAEEFIRAFVPWFNEWVWGTMDEPGEV